MQNFLGPKRVPLSPSEAPLLPGAKIYAIVYGIIWKHVLHTFNFDTYLYSCTKYVKETDTADKGFPPLMRMNAAGHFFPPGGRSFAYQIRFKQNWYLSVVLPYPTSPNLNPVANMRLVFISRNVEISKISFICTFNSHWNENHLALSAFHISKKRWG